MMKKLSTGFSIGALLLPIAALAQYGAGETAKELGYSKSENLYSIIAKTTGVLLSMIAIIFFGVMLYAGMRWMLARGNEEFAEKAKHTLTAASIGFIVVVASYALTRFIFGKIVP